MSEIEEFVKKKKFNKKYYYIKKKIRILKSNTHSYELETQLSNLS